MSRLGLISLAREGRRCVVGEEALLSCPSFVWVGRESRRERSVVVLVAVVVVRGGLGEREGENLGGAYTGSTFEVRGIGEFGREAEVA